MHAAIKIQVRITKDRRIQLPEDLPLGQAEIIVLYPDATVVAKKARPSASRTTAKQSEIPPGKSARRTSKTATLAHVNYFARLTERQPTSLSEASSRALDEADRGER